MKNSFIKQSQISSNNIDNQKMRTYDPQATKQISIADNRPLQTENDEVLSDSRDMKQISEDG